MPHGRFGNMTDLSFYRGKKVFVTGHTGFKGTWLCRILLEQGAVVTGYSLEPPTVPSLFSVADLEGEMNSVIGDICDFANLRSVFEKAAPEIVFHLAAQPLVRESYREPRMTYETNVMGTVNILECVRTCKSVKSFLNVTTDKVYLNMEKEEGFTEDMPLDGFDPYSNSKSCSELVTHSYRNAFFAEGATAISTARAGNVIGGGDFAKNRIVPDCFRAAWTGEAVSIRNPHSVRPFQHVLEPLVAYLIIAREQYMDNSFSGYYNVGPQEEDCVTTSQLVQMFCQAWGEGMSYVVQPDDGPHEAGFLKLNCDKLKNTFHWSPKWGIQTAMEKTVAFGKVYFNRGNIKECMKMQIMDYLK